MIDKFKDAFKEEAEELLSSLEGILLELEEKPDDAELLNAAFRAAHTIKGSAGMFGFDAIGRFTHDLENAMDKARSGQLAITHAFTDLALRSRDHIRALLAAGETPDPALEHQTELLLAELRSVADLGAVATLGEEAASPTGNAISKVYETGGDEEGEAAAVAVLWRLTFKPGRAVFMNGTRVLRLLEDLAELGDCAFFPHTEEIPTLEALDPESCYCSWDIIVSTDKGENALRDIFIFIEDQAELDITRIEEASILQGRDQPKRLGEILIERGIVSREALDEALKSQRRLGEVLVERKLASREQVESALVEQEHLKRVKEHQVEGVAASVRVASDKLDQLVDLVGELVTLQARLFQTSLDLKDPSLNGISEQFERLISQLRDNTMSIRMLPIGSTFNKFRRLVRDLSKGLGKDVELVAEGGDTELDKTVIERLGDPLVHIIRNSLDHGIETPELRQAANKPPVGTIRLSAMHSGAYVLIQVADDGAGLNHEAIRAKAIQRGLIGQNQELSEQDVEQLIFAPGFSTAAAVTSVSGRGVGMDVVKREIDTLGGSVLLSSRAGLGTTITLKIPLTLAIIEGLLVRIGPEFYIVPLSSVDGCIEVRREEVAEKDGRRIISYRGELLPYIPLRSHFSIPGESPEILQVVIVNALDARIGFVVDQVVGDNQTVVKPLGRMYRDAEGFSGATILGDGSVALILDANRLSLVAKTEGARRSGRELAVDE